MNPVSELIKMPATQIVGLLKAKKVSSMELLNEVEARIQSIDSSINALPTLCFERARAHAEIMDSAKSHKKSQAGVLAGIPVPIKDLTDVAGVKTTFGSAVYTDNISARSDILVEHLERQGGIIYAKSNTPEFGTGGNTYNKVFGMTRNPWNQELSVAGSSGGAAAALATGMAWLAHGSDMGGSLRNPASFCGVTGLRPGIGRVASTPRSDVIDTLATNGPMARNVADLALMLDAMCGHEPLDPLSIPKPETTFLRAASRPALPKSIAYSLTLGITPVDAQVEQVFMRAMEKIADAGTVVEEKSPDFNGLHEIFHTLRAYSYASSLGDLLKHHEPQLNPHVIWNIEAGLKLTLNDVIRAQTRRVELVRRVQKFFHENELLLTPATVVPPYPVLQTHVTECNGEKFDNYYQWLSIAYAFTTALCPAMSLPCGFTEHGLPVGLQIASKAYGEASMLCAAAALEYIFGMNKLVPIHPKPAAMRPNRNL